MSEGRADKALRWYAIYTHPKQENRAESNLEAWKVETFHPKIRTRRPNLYGGRPVHETKSLFPRYIFARFDAGLLLHKIWFTRGVRGVVSLGTDPAPVEDYIIDLIRSRVGADGFVRIGEEIKPGDKVVIREGPLRNLVGIFERELKDSERVQILLDAVSFQGRIVVDREAMAKAS